MRLSTQYFQSEAKQLLHDMEDPKQQHTTELSMTQGDHFYPLSMTT